MAIEVKQLRNLEDALDVLESMPQDELYATLDRMHAEKLKAKAYEAEEQARFFRNLAGDRESLDDSSYEEMLDCFLEAAQLYEQAGDFDKADLMYANAGIESVEYLENN